MRRDGHCIGGHPGLPDLVERYLFNRPAPPEAWAGIPVTGGFIDSFARLGGTAKTNRAGPIGYEPF